MLKSGSVCFAGGSLTFLILCTLPTPHPNLLILFILTYVFSLQGPRWQIDLQPWAGPARSLDEEALRFLRYISTIQVVFQAQVGLETVKDASCPF